MFIAIIALVSGIVVGAVLIGCCWYDSIKECERMLMSVSLPDERTINEIRGKLMVNKATDQEIKQFLVYVSFIEGLVEEASNEDFYGSEGYRHLLGWD